MTNIPIGKNYDYESTDTVVGIIKYKLSFSVIYNDFSDNKLFEFRYSTKPIQKVKKVCAYSPRTCFCCSRSLFSGVQCDVENCLVQLHIGPCHVISAEITAAMAVQIENPADRDVRGVIRFLQADEILSYIAEEASSRVELFCCKTMHVRILPGRHTSLAVREIPLGLLRAFST